MDQRLEKAFAMRMLLGLMGEIHQPMRMITRVTPNYLGGDHGGELFPIEFTQKTRNLKSLWDTAMGRILSYKRVLF